MWGRLALAMVVAATGCFGADARICANGVTCPRGTICDLPRDRCVPEGQRDACNGLDEGDPCSFLGATGVCDQGVCAASICGNGLIDEGEVCDDGNSISGDGCRDDCQSDERCGSGALDEHLGEQCDCGEGPEPGGDCSMANSDDPGASCKTDCTLHCGDGVINAAEDCDSGDFGGVACLHFGFEAGALGCNATCNYTFAGCRQIGWRTHALPSTSYDLHLHGDGTLFSATTEFLTSFSDPIWRIEARTLPAVIYSVGSAGADVLLGSQGSVLRYDGVSLSSDPVPDPSAALFGIKGFASGDAFAAAGQDIYRWSGGAWVSAGYDLGSNVTKLEGTAPDNLFGAAANGGLVHFDGTRWTRVDLGAAATIVEVWLRDDTDIYAIGTTALHFDGQWQPIDVGLTNPQSVTGDSRFTYIFGGGQAVYGFADRWASLGTPSVLVWESAVDSLGHVHGTAFLDDATRLPGNLVKTQAITNVTEIAAIDFDEAIAVGVSASPVRRYDGFTWSDDPTFTDAVNLRAVFARSSTEIYVAGGDKIYRFNGATWEDISPGGGGENVVTLAGNADAVYAGGTLDDLVTPAIWRLENDQWLPETIDTVLAFGVTHLHVAADGTAVAAQRGLLRRQGGVWRLVATGAASAIIDVWASAADDIWVVGLLGGARHFDGASWSSFEVEPTGLTLNAIDGTAANDVFTVAGDGTLHHYDGQRWSPVAVPFVGSISSLSATTHSLQMSSVNQTVELVRLVPWN